MPCFKPDNRFFLGTPFCSLGSIANSQGKFLSRSASDKREIINLNQLNVPLRLQCSTDTVINNISADML